MSLAIHFLQPLDTRVCVNLSRRDRRMTKQLLHGTQVRAGIEQVRRESVAKRVRGKTGILVDAIEEAGYRFLDRTQRNALSAIAQEECHAVGALHALANELVAFRLV